jgi:plasmid stability protein
MTKLTVRNLEDDVVASLKARAESQGRSLEGEVRHILREAARAPTPRQLRTVAERITAMTPAGQPQTDSTEMIRAERDRDL